MLVHGGWSAVLDSCSHGRAINAKELPADNAEPSFARVLSLTNEKRGPPSEPTWSLARRGPGARGSAPGSEEVKTRDEGPPPPPFRILTRGYVLVAVLRSSEARSS